MNKQYQKSFSKAARHLSVASREGDRKGFKRAKNAMEEAETIESLTTALDEYFEDDQE